MRTSIAISALFLFFDLSSVNAAQQIKLDFSLETKDNAHQSGSIVTPDGQSGIIKFKDLTLKLTPKKTKTGLVKINIEISNYSQDPAAKPKLGTIITHLNSVAEMSSRDGKGLIYKLKVTPSI